MSISSISWVDANQRYLMAALAPVRHALECYIKRMDGAVETANPQGGDFQQALDATLAAMPAPPALTRLCTVFGLSPFERNIVLLCAGVDLDGSFAAFYNAAHNSKGREPHTVAERAAISYPTFSLALAVLPQPHWDAITPSAPLRHWQLIMLVVRHSLGGRDEPRPGQIFLIVLPKVDAALDRILPERLVLSAELRSAVLSHLESRCLLGVKLEVLPPQYIWVSVQAEVRVAECSNAVLVSEVQQNAEAALYRYLNPHVGGPYGKGWPFGRNLNRSELYGVLQNIEHVEFVEDVQMSLCDGSESSQHRRNL